MVGDAELTGILAAGPAAQGCVHEPIKGTSGEDLASVLHGATNVQEVGSPLPRRCRLAGQERVQAVQFTVLGEVPEVRDQISPRKERGRSCCKLDKQRLRSKGVKPIRPGSEIEVTATQKDTTRAEVARGCLAPVEPQDFDKRSNSNVPPAYSSNKT